jgi:DNA recombination protein RmuC
MSIPVVILLALIGVVVGAVFAMLLARSRNTALAERKSGLEQELAAVRCDLSLKQTEISSLLTARASLEATLAAEREAEKEKLQLLSEARAELENTFQALASSALQSNNASFLELARSALEKYQSQAKGELEAREKAVETLIKPIAESLKQVDEQVRELEKARAQAYGTLTSQVASLLDTQKALQAETGNLVKALREPQARGRWGELQLRRVIELAGMLDFCDFEEQVSVTNEDRRYRPDVVVKLPGGKNIVIDAKVPLTAYLAALEADDDTVRSARLSDHARQIKQHIDNLAGKSYWAQFQPTPEFVVLFLPGEVFFRAALDGDAELIEYGVGQRVIVASPTTLIALLKAVAYGWNQKNLAENAQKISETGSQLYERLCVMARHFENIGNRLSAAVDAYNSAVGSMQRSVFPVARRFAELDKSLAAEDLQEVGPVEKTSRQLDASDWRDGDGNSGLLFPGEKADSAKI